MLKLVAIGLAALAAAFVVVVSLQPAELRVARSTTVSAPPAVVFAQLNDLHAFNQWSPFAKRDPATKQTFGGPPTGQGASMAWAGNAEVGEGRMTITESRPNEIVRYRLEFLKPFENTAEANIALRPDGDRTTVTWGMVAPNNFIAKAMHLFLDMDEMVGGDFEKGLADLKSIAERKA
jgi:uncharacterized protein YndB with AHSA1/START domain